MKKHTPAIERVVFLDRRRGNALFDFVKSLADAGDEKAAAFLNKLLGGGFDWPQDEPGKTLPVDDAKRGNES
jgi:hypothetical protein